MIFQAIAKEITLIENEIFINYQNKDKIFINIIDKQIALYLHEKIQDEDINEFSIKTISDIEKQELIKITQSKNNTKCFYANFSEKQKAEDIVKALCEFAGLLRVKIFNKRNAV